MADQLVYFGNSADGTPRTGLTLTWVSLLKVSDGTAFNPQPVFTEVGAGFYKFPGVVSQDVCGSIDGGATLPTADRYIRDIAMGTEDVNLVKIDGNPTNNNTATLALKQLTIINPDNADAVRIQATNAVGGNAIVATSVADTGLYLTGVHGLEIQGGINGVNVIGQQSGVIVTGAPGAVINGMVVEGQTGIINSININNTITYHKRGDTFSRVVFMNAGAAGFSDVITSSSGSILYKDTFIPLTYLTHYTLTIIDSQGSQGGIDWLFALTASGVALLPAIDNVQMTLGFYAFGGTQTSLSYNLPFVMVPEYETVTLGAVQADTDNIQTRLPAALVGGKMDSTTTLGADAITAAVLAADAVSEIATSVRSGITTDHGAGAYGAGVAGANNVTITLLNATAAAQTITAATKASNCQLTIPAHGRSNGDKAVIAGVGGMVELNNRLVTVTVVDANNITIGVDSTAFTTFTSGGTITKTDETAIQSAHLSIYDVTNTNLYATAETNASGVSVQGSNGYVAMDSGNYILRPTRSLMNATGSYAFNVSATGTKYFVATALAIPAINTPGTQTLIISAKELGAPWAVGDAVVITPAGKQVVGSAVLSTAPISAVIAANGQAQQTAGVDGVAVDIGAKVTVKVGDYYTKTITVDSTPVKNITAYV